MINTDVTQEKFSNYFLKEILLCGNKLHLIIGIFIAVFKSIAFYVIVFLQNKNEPLEVTMIYSGLGDIQYYQFLPYIGSFKFGESQVYENLNQGLVGFTLPSIFLHSVLFANLGIAGFILANIIIIYLFYCFLLATLKLTGIPHILAFSITALLTSGYYVHTFFEKILNVKLFTLWGEVFPRTFVSEIFFLVILTLTMLITPKYDIIIKSKLFWILLGIFTSFLLQANPYFGIPIILFLSALYIYIHILLNLKVKNIKQILQNSLVGFLSFIISLGPFIIQQILVSSDIKRRYGQFPVKKIEFLSLDKYNLLVFSVLIIQLLIPYLLIKSKKINLSKLKNRLTINSLLIVLVFCAYISMPLFLFITHKGIQLSKFALVLNIVTSYSLIISFCLVISDIIIAISNDKLQNLLQKYHRFFNFFIYSFIFLIALKSMFVINNYRSLQTNHMRMDLYPGVNRNYYRQDYADLIKELKNPQYKNLKVLGTFDHQVQVYWQTFKKANSYVPDIFISTISDEESELRLIKLAKIINLNQNDFINYITLIKPGKPSRQSINFFGLAKYQVNKQYTFKPLEEYSQEQQKIINNNSILNSWDLIIPKSEIERMKNKFDNTKVESLDNPKLDFIVLTNDSFFNSFAPDKTKFQIVFENKTFRMWVKK